MPNQKISSVRASLGLAPLILGLLALLYLILTLTPTEVETDPPWFTLLLFIFVSLSVCIKTNMMSDKKVKLVNAASLVTWLAVMILPFTFVDSQDLSKLMGSHFSFIYVGFNTANSAELSISDWPIGFHLSYMTIMFIWPIVDFLDLCFQFITKEKKR